MLSSTNRHGISWVISKLETNEIIIKKRRWYQNTHIRFNFIWKWEALIIYLTIQVLRNRWKGILLLVFFPNRRCLFFSCPVTATAQESNRWLLDVLYHRVWYLLDWCRCVPGQGYHAGTSILLRSPKEWHCDLVVKPLHNLDCIIGACVCTFSSIDRHHASVVVAHLCDDFASKFRLGVCVQVEVIYAL